MFFPLKFAIHLKFNSNPLQNIDKSCLEILILHENFSHGTKIQCGYPF